MNLCASGYGGDRRAKSRLVIRRKIDRNAEAIFVWNPFVANPESASDCDDFVGNSVQSSRRR